MAKKFDEFDSVYDDTRGSVDSPYLLRATNPNYRPGYYYTGVTEDSPFYESFIQPNVKQYEDSLKSLRDSAASGSDFSKRVKLEKVADEEKKYKDFLDKYTPREFKYGEGPGSEQYGLDKYDQLLDYLKSKNPEASPAPSQPDFKKEVEYAPPEQGGSGPGDGPPEQPNFPKTPAGGKPPMEEILKDAEDKKAGREPDYKIPEDAKEGFFYPTGLKEKESYKESFNESFQSNESFNRRGSRSGTGRRPDGGESFASFMEQMRGRDRGMPEEIRARIEGDQERFKADKAAFMKEARQQRRFDRKMFDKMRGSRGDDPFGGGSASRGVRDGGPRLAGGGVRGTRGSRGSRGGGGGAVRGAR